MRQIKIIAHDRNGAITEDGEQYPIVGMFDSDGEDTDDMNEARAIVVKINDNKWLTIDLTDFEEVTHH